MIYQMDVLRAFSDLIGETAIPSQNIEQRKRWAQSALEKAYRMYPFELGLISGTITVANGIGALPTDAAQDPHLDVRISVPGQDNDRIFTQYPYADQDTDDEDGYWITGFAGSYVIHFMDPSVTGVTVQYSLAAPQLSDVIGTPFPSAEVLAYDMLPKYRQSTDPEYDKSQDDAVFEREIARLWTQQKRNAPRRRYKGRDEVHGTYTGNIY